jgi:multicomponent Na+:H+ antiporter subunit A
VLLERGADLLTPPILVVSLYLLFAGHNAPGGGFVAGLTAGLAIALRHAAGGPDAIRAAIRFAPAALLGTGLVVAGLTGAGGLLLGGGFLDGGAWSFRLPALGEVKATSALAFDTGVYLVVTGMVAMALEALGTREHGS